MKIMSEASYEAGDTGSLPSSLSTQSSPTVSYEPFQPHFAVKIKQPIKDGDTVQYTLHVKDTETGQEICTQREYEDFASLHQHFVSLPEFAGVIVPPLPPTPVVGAQLAAENSKVRLGRQSKVVVADEYQRDCKRLEKYLRLLVNHSVLGNDNQLRIFLSETKALTRNRIKKSILERISCAVEETRKSSHRDIDDYFQNEREQANEFALCLTSAELNFQRMTASQQRISAAYGHLVTALNIGGNVDNSAYNKAANSLLASFAQVLTDTKHCCDVDFTNDENTMGSHLHLYRAYANSVKEMLFRRTCLLLNYEDANRALDRAKPHQLRTAEENKVAAEMVFDDCSELARRELLAYHHQKRVAFEQAIVLYTEAKIRTARDTYAVLAKSLANFKQL